MEEKNFLGLEGLKYFWTKIEAKVIKIIEDEIAQIIAEAPESLNTLKEIADWISTHEDSASAMNTAILANTEAISGKADKSHTHTKSQITDFDHTHDDRYYTESEVDTKLSGKADKSHTHTKSQITDFPTSLPANGGTADSANNGFNSSTTIDSTPGWGYLTSGNGYSNGRTYSFANGGGIATAEKDTKSSLQVDGDLYVHEGLDKVATLNDIPTSLPANGGTASSCSGNSATATQLQTARTINIQDSSATYTGTGASFNGSGDATIKLPSTIKANEFKIDNEQQSIAYRSKSYNGFKMHEAQTKALYIEGRESDAGDSGGLAITNDSVTVFGAGDTDGVFRVVNEDKAGNGSATAPAIFNIFKDGNVTMTGQLTAPSATIGSRPVITGTYSASDGILSLYTN